MSRILQDLIGGELTLYHADGSCEPSSELVGTVPGGTLGIVIGNVDPLLIHSLGIAEDIRTLGIFSSRTKANAHVMAVDEAIKQTNARLVKALFPRDGKGGGGNGGLFILHSDSLADMRRAIEICLREVPRYSGEYYENSEGSVEVQFSSRVGEVCHRIYGAAENSSFGLVSATPAAIGLLMADVALKSGAVEPIGTQIPDGSRQSNEVTLLFSGENEAVHQALTAARSTGIQLLNALCDGKALPCGKGYI